MALNSLGASSARHGIVLHDINSTVDISSTNYAVYIQGGYESIPVQGYSAIRLRLRSSTSATARYVWVYSDGTTSSDLTQSVLKAEYAEISIPSNAVCMKFDTFLPSGTTDYLVFGLIAL